ncbi:MAG TPA: tRNA threonylcarbamoyladenosine dehydratase [Porphyromonadaceae bacterium]|jgi:tRNA A37 threonylcarbamoyladenosine dehydratase|nr:tRNA threonylcarbamoyladenosine dehydratase [Porphyromonadaceae bacterium]HBX20759.1 tRNA threonylcarbamoyladenosine dehydratase [Porphyromonadaceae bacterium]HCM20184.1 tRNA threonylcarbamoyladenosine dehydratase [Porphyromonadaceae bacterium]
MGIEKALFQRTELLMGEGFMQHAADKRVIIFGIGGVGSWCAESLIRSGIKHLTLVDSDRICITNVNRQLIATTKTIGKVKVEILRDRLLEINPRAEIVALQKIYSPETHDSFRLDSYDYIIDAIDSLSNKIHLIREAVKTHATFFSSMGAALKIDPTRIRVAEFMQVKGCPLGAALRKRIRREGGLNKEFLCVYSDELLQNKGQNTSCGTEKCLCPKAVEGPGDPDLANHEWCSQKARINGTSSYIPAMFGMTIASLVVMDIDKQAMKQPTLCEKASVSHP